MQRASSSRLDSSGMGLGPQDDGMAFERGYSGSDADYDERGPLTPTTAAVTNENFRVYIRVRPPVPRELEGTRFINVVRFSGDHQQITICDVDTDDDNRGSVYATQSFSFDYVYDQDARQRDVYERSAHPAVQSVLQGYNATVMAYGQTGTGKTYTMEGFTNGEHRGIIPQSIEAIFAHIKANRRPDVQFKVRASYLQIYKEVVSDLLSKHSATSVSSARPSLQIRQQKGRVSVEGLSEWLVRTPNDVFELMERGCSGRATSAHRMSELSSRSHAIFQIVVEIHEGDDEVGRTFKLGKLNIVDLAGSEKVRSTGVTGERLEEAKKINWSLHQLGNVISALSDLKRQDPHIPYRNSKLTHLLMDSLGGNCKTTLIACISPAYESYGESVSTLKFANRAKNIKNEARINEDSDQSALVAKYQAEIFRLRALLGENAGSAPPGLLPAGADERDRLFDQQKREKQRLEGRIGDLERQLLSSGITADEDRTAQREDVAQVDRYKQLLLKQRDIMLNLTQRLNERDETILRLQEELDAYDQHVTELEEQVERGGGGGHAAPHMSAQEAERRIADAKVFMRGGEARYRSLAPNAAADRLLTAEEMMLELLSSRGLPTSAGGYGQNHSGAASSDPAARKALEDTLAARADGLAKQLVQEHCQTLIDEITGLRASLAAAEQQARLPSIAGDVHRGAAFEQQVDKVRDFVRDEARAAQEAAQQHVAALKQQLAEERRGSRQLAAELARLRFDVREAREATMDGQRRRELDNTWAEVAAIEQAVFPGLLKALERAAVKRTTEAAAGGQGGAQPPQASSQMRVMQLESAVDTLKRQQAATRQEMQAQIDERSQRIRELEARSGGSADEVAALKRALSTHEKDRAALKKILEQRVKVKLDNIAGGIRSGARVDQELGSLQTLIAAAIDAMNAEQPAANPQPPRSGANSQR